LKKFMAAVLKFSSQNRGRPFLGYIFHKR